MGDALTTSEVERLVRLATGRLYAVAWPGKVPEDLQGIVNNARANIDDAAGYLNELLLLLDFVDDVEHGRAVVVDQGEPEPAAAALPASECEPFNHGSLCRRDECLCFCHTIPPHTPGNRR